jgi:hypothetical protein
MLIPADEPRSGAVIGPAADRDGPAVGMDHIGHDGEADVEVV